MAHMGIAAGFLGLMICTNTMAERLEVQVFKTDDQKTSLGNVIFEDTDYGLLIQPQLHDLPPGMLGFHIHQINNCGKMGMDAGGHYDPENSNTHLGPYAEGHLGDLPALIVDLKGNANLSTLAPRLDTSALSGKALMIHEGGDTYSDTPPLGGGGKRLGCGVFSN